MLASAAPITRDADDLADASPEPAQRAQAGDGKELVRGRRHAEFELGEGVRGTDAGVFQVTEVGDARRDRETQLIDVRGPGVVVGQHVDGERPHARKGLQGRGHPLPVRG